MLSYKDMRYYIDQFCFGLICIGAMAFPFSVAVTNIALAGALITGLASGAFMEGIRFMWQHYRPLSAAWIAYLLLFPVGLLWSLDVHWGLQIIGRQWFWLLLPLVVDAVQKIEKRRLFLIAISLGLGLNLFYCLAQFFGWVELLGKAGSSASNPTGHIGHTSFGLVYGLWAAFLMHWSLFLEHWKRWAARIMSIFSVGMIFLASGRGGYLVVTTLFLILIWKLLRMKPWLKLSGVMLVLIIMIIALSVGPGKQRVLTTWQSIEMMQQGNFQNPEVRWSMWYAAIQSWRQHKPLGVGTGGYHIAAKYIKQQKPDLMYGSNSWPIQPHNMFLQSLSRWGPLGVLCLSLLFFFWLRTGWRCDWHMEPTSGLVSLTAIALLVQGMTEPSFEEHFPGILAALLCGAGLAANYKQKKTSLNITSSN